VGRLTVELLVEGRVALVVGAGDEVAAKAARLVDGGAIVRVVTPSPDARVAELAAAGQLELRRRAFEAADLDGAFVVFVAPSEVDLGASLASQGRLVSTIDRPEASTFTSVAVLEASGLRVTIGTAGASPGLARRLREDLAALLAEPRLGRFVAMLGRARAALPRGERARAMGAAVEGFRLSGALAFPAWFERGDPPPAAPCGDEPA
jgi:precorrin-2 dehydrogenase/sirohydrochlorin ferrochelatase